MDDNESVARDLSPYIFSGSLDSVTAEEVLKTRRQSIVRQDTGEEPLQIRNHYLDSLSRFIAREMIALHGYDRMADLDYTKT